MSTHSFRRSPRIATLIAASLLIAVPVLASGPLTPKNMNRSQIQKADQLFNDFKAKKLSPEDEAAYRSWRKSARQKQRQALNQQPSPTTPGAARLATPGGTPTPPGGPQVLAGAGGVQQSCHCTATCQTVLVVNGGSIYFEGEGEVPSPSACADAAEAFCGGAVSSFLHHWNCK